MKPESIRKRLGRKKIKSEAVAYKGGKCIRCGYSRCLAALQFHHRHREEKSFSLSLSQKTNFESVKSEQTESRPNWHRIRTFQFPDGVTGNMPGFEPGESTFES